MFRTWFNEPKRVDDGPLLEAISAIRAYRVELQRLIKLQNAQCGRYTRLDIWCRGLINAVYELEESVYAAGKYCEKVTHRREEEMSEEELEIYRCHVYFYKNGLIRLFSVLDKLGYLMNELLNLRTQRVKHKFSYFTVLRQMQHLHAEQSLAKPLIQLKDKHQEQLNRLRHKRNMEIHLVNSEMLDDLQRIDECRTDQTYIEDLKANMVDLQNTFEMVCKTLSTAFAYMRERKKT